MRLAHRLLSLMLIAALAACGSAPRQPAARLQVDRLLHQGARQHDAGNLEQAQQSFQDAVAASERIDDIPSLVRALLAEGANALLLGRIDVAETSYARAVHEAGTENLTDLLLPARAGVAETWRRSGRIEQATELYRAIAREPRLPAQVRVSVANGLALSLLAQDRADIAEGLLLEAVVPAREVSAYLHATTLANLARLALARQETELAATRAHQALEIDRRLYYPPGIAADHALLAEIFRRTGNGELATRHRQSAERIQLQTGQMLPSDGR